MDTLMLLFLVASCSSFMVVAQVDTADIHLIDLNVSSGNYLFRMAIPDNVSGAGNFEYDAVVAALRATASQRNVSLPSDFLLHDICLLTTEKADIGNETLFFKENPSLGYFTAWPTYGSTLNPNSVSPSKRNATALNFTSVSSDNLPQKATELREMMATPRTVPQVHFVHCYLGMDRTGEISGTYYMSSLGLSFERALTIDDTINPDDQRSIVCQYLYALQWYCYYRVARGEQHDACQVPSNLPKCFG